MSSNEKIISPYIPSQFPAHYRENDPQFVEFVKVYYEWLEAEDQAVGRTKRLIEYRDIDETLEDFIVFFKNKYLPLFKFDTATDKRLIIKHVLDLYRSKGTERGIDLFFRLVYGTPAEVYYPSTDLFRLSDNTWARRQYLEVSQHPTLGDFPGKQVLGKRSGASAFVEKYVTKKIGNRYAYVLFISNIVGSFETGEQVYYDGTDSETFPFIVGSMNTLDVTTGGTAFSVGDLVTLESSLQGSGGIGRVANTANTTGIVNFELIDGGWGYTSNSIVYVSEKTLTLNNLVPDANTNNLDIPGYSNGAFFRLETITQPMANLVYGNLSNSSVILSNGSILTSYYSNSSVASTVKVLTSTESNSTAGEVLVSLLTGNSEINTYFWTSSNTASINVQTYTDSSASGKVVGSKTQTLSISNSTIRFAANQFVYQADNSFRTTAIGLITSVEYAGTFGTLRVKDVVGRFIPSQNVFMRYANGVNNTSVNAYLSVATGEVGVANITGTFVYLQNAYVKSESSNSIANVTFISGGQGATFDISPTLGYADSYLLFTDFLRDTSTLNVAFMNTALNAVDFGFPAAPGGSDITTLLGDALDSFSGNVGSVTRLISINPGEDYTAAPYVLIYEPYTAGFNKRDYYLSIDLLSSNFTLGEEVTQDNGAKGLITQIVNTSLLAVRRTSLYTNFDQTESNTIIIGSFSGATANLQYAAVNQSSLPIGLNAVVSSNVVTANGIVTKLEVIDSGYNYKQDETVDFISSDGLRAGTAKVNLITHGTSQGQFIDESSFLSDSKYLFDGYYYQEYSYDIKSSISKQRFEGIYNQTMHLAGTQMFSTFVHTSVNETKIDAFLPEGANTQPV